LELENGRPKGRQSATAIVELIGAGLVQEVSLGRAEVAVFLDLVAGPAGQTLDDGEAATIAFALSANAIALIDERKATALCARRYPNLRVMSTVDLLLSSLIKDAFDKDWLGECLFKALSIARMRVPDQHRSELCNLLGPERLRQCKSLPTAWRDMTDLQSSAGRPA
jgi:predicted nucleic acid-binding protein